MFGIFQTVKQYLSERKVAFSILAALIIGFTFSLPSRLFDDPYATVLEDRNGEMLAARIADDGQWRFPQIEKVPEKFKTCLLHFEDKRFSYHPGFDPLAFARAIRQNLSKKKVVSGGSTITMQVIRLSRKGKRRTIFEKAIELILSVRAECTYSKEEILQLYASHAPFGGNVVGLEAASWRYFGRSPEHLSWAESATLAVLPNSPNLIYPGKNTGKLRAKRDRLLKKLSEAGVLNKLSYELSIMEDLPLTPHTLPRHAPHFLDRMIMEGHKGERIRSTLVLHLQQRVNEIVEQNHLVLKANEVHNAACVIIDPRNGDVLAYCGNTKNSDGQEVDIIRAPRSTGSILKPLLYASMLNEGQLFPETLIPDIPTQISGFAPKNFNLTYDGAIPAKEALARSLNIPAVKMLQTYGIEKFHHRLKKMGISTLRFHPDHYGLSLILGGAEATLWDITGIYSKLAFGLGNRKETFKAGYAFKNDAILPQEPLVDKSSAWLTFEAMEEVARPDAESSYQLFSSGRKVAWKTGTSFGFRDAWAVGVTPEFTVGVWAGNADGEGRPELTGIKCAAPLLFDVFSILPATTWFQEPERDFEKVMVCKKSGYRALDLCTEKQVKKVPKAGKHMTACPYHQLVHLNSDKTYRVNLECEEEIVTESYFVLPPAMEWYYKKNDPSYKVLPPVKEGCAQNREFRNMEFIYPRESHKIYLPIGLNGVPGRMVAELAHRRPDTKVHWHLDNQFIKTTSGFHQLGLTPTPGVHYLTAVDENGETITQVFEILDKSM